MGLDVSCAQWMLCAALNKRLNAKCVGVSLTEALVLVIMVHCWVVIVLWWVRRGLKVLVPVCTMVVVGGKGGPVT